MNVEFLSADLPETGCVIVTCEKDKKLSAVADHYNKICGGLIKKAFETEKFSGEKGQVLVLTPQLDGLNQLAVVGVGEAASLKDQDWVDIGGDLLATLNKTNVKKAAFVMTAGKDSAREAAHLAEGALLRSYKFDKYKTKGDGGDGQDFDLLSILCDDLDQAKDFFDPLEKRLAGVTVTRDLVSEVPNVLYPASMAARLKELESYGLEVEVLRRADLEKLGMNALLAIGQGSDKEEHVVVMRYNGGSVDEQPLAFVGKGVTFDSGGISLKVAGGMHDMKWDMGGAAVVSGLMVALANRKAKVNAVGVVGLVENMPSGKASRPGDVVKAMSGTTIEILNTDAEGRVVLADVLWYAQEKYNPKLVIDLATLTGAIIVALGEEISGVFTNTKELAERLYICGEEVDEKNWEMPMHKLYDSHIDSDVADIKNLGKPGRAGSISAAKFLERFIKKGMPWAHIDIAGSTWANSASHMFDKGASGYGVRLLDTFVRKYYEGK